MSKDNNNGDKKKQNKKRLILIISLIILIILCIIAGVFLKNNKTKEEENTLAYTDLIKELSYGNVEKIEMKTGSTTVTVKMKDVEEEKTAIVPNIESFMELVQNKGAEGNEIELIQKPKSVVAQIPSIIISFLPTASILSLISFRLPKNILKFSSAMQQVIRQNPADFPICTTILLRSTNPAMYPVLWQA